MCIPIVLNSVGEYVYFSNAILYYTVQCYIISIGDSFVMVDFPRCNKCFEVTLLTDFPCEVPQVVCYSVSLLGVFIYANKLYGGFVGPLIP